MPNKYTLDIVKQKSIEKFGDIYDFSHAEYKGMIKEMKIGCRVHGFKMIKPSNFLAAKLGCPDCGIDSKRLDVSTFVTKCIAKYGDEFDLTHTGYTRMDEMIIVGCDVHGDFELKASSFIASVHGCPACAMERSRSSTEHIIQRIYDKHGDKFDYSRIKDVTMTEEMIIGCPIHGWLNITPKDFLNTKHGCVECWLESRNFTTEEWLDIAEGIHGDKYEYPKGNFYKNSKTKIKIYCKEHDYYFMQRGNKHIGKQQQGCPLYHRSRGEQAVGKWMNDRNIIFSGQHTFPDCVDKAVLRFDFMIEIDGEMILIEYNGEQHYKELGGYYSGELKGIKRRDKIKFDYCKDNSIPFLIIRYDEDVDTVLNNYFDM